jgi:hypothetical protein
MCFFGFPLHLTPCDNEFTLCSTCPSKQSKLRRRMRYALCFTEVAENWLEEYL